MSCFFILQIEGPYAQRIPADSSIEGAKWICDPHRIRKKKDCLVYSVGSFGNTKFETGIKSEIGEHCEIHTFDVDTTGKNGDYKELVEATGANFHHWGLGTQAQVDEFKKNPEGALPMKTLRETMELLNHTGRVIDIFKIDCEGCEWETYNQWLEVGDLRQILVETHYIPMPTIKEFFYSLHDAGYVIFSKEANYMWPKGVEFAFVKLHTDFFVNDSMYSKLSTKKNTK